MVCCLKPSPQAEESSASCSIWRQRLSKSIEAVLRMAVAAARNAVKAPQTSPWDSGVQQLFRKNASISVKAPQTSPWDSGARGALTKSVLPVQQPTFF